MGMVMAVDCAQICYSRLPQNGAESWSSKNISASERYVTDHIFPGLHCFAMWLSVYLNLYFLVLDDAGMKILQVDPNTYKFLEKKWKEGKSEEEIASDDCGLTPAAASEF